MSEWKSCKIGDLVTLRQGFAINSKSKHYISKDPTSLALLRIADMKSGAKEIFIKEDIPQNFIAKPEDIIYTRTGNVGLVFKNCYGVVHNNCFTVTPNDENELTRDFLFYLLQSKTFFDKANSLARGAAQPDLPHTLFNSIEISYPPLPIQHRITTILSRYDTLIENYQKQIKLLEEATQRLYKEWFVDLRFPGYENVKMVDGLPEGWERRTLDSFCNVFTGKKNANQGVSNGKYKFFTCGDMPLSINSFIYDGPAIIISGNGSYTGRTTFYEGKFDLYQRTYACTIKEIVNRELIYGLYEIVKCGLTNKISGGTHGAAIPYIVMNDVTKFSFIYNKDVFDAFSRIIKSNISTILMLSSQIRLLAEARDRLLPRLMGGEINV